MKKRNVLLELFLSFMKIGFFTFGGGYAMIPVMDDLFVEKKKWISHDDMMNITVIAESTPGPIAINCSTFIGYRCAGLAGAVISTLGVVLPSFVVIFLISMVLDNFLEITLIANAFKGIRIAVGILICDAAVSMLQKMKKKPLPVAIFILAFGVMLAVNLFSLNFSSIALMLLCAAMGLTAFLLTEKGGDGR